MYQFFKFILKINFLENKTSYEKKNQFWFVQKIVLYIYVIKKNFFYYTTFLEI